MRNAPCPCGSGLKTKRCCLEVIEGRRPAATPEDLLRARYVAYGTGAVGFLIASTDPRGSQWRTDLGAWRAELARYCAAVKLDGLAIGAASVDGELGFVRYVARLRLGGEAVVLAEDARYRCEGGRWLYTDGTVT